MSNIFGSNWSTEVQKNYPEITARWRLEPRTGRKLGWRDSVGRPGRDPGDPARTGSIVHQRSLVIAAILSLFLSGFGQMYHG